MRRILHHSEAHDTEAREKTHPGESAVQRIYGRKLRGLRRIGIGVPGPYYLVRLRPLLPLDDVELYIVALFETLISIHLDRAVVNEHIGPVIPANEPVPLGVVEPLHLASVLSHVREPSCQAVWVGDSNLS